MSVFWTSTWSSTLMSVFFTVCSTSLYAAEVGNSQQNQEAREAAAMGRYLSSRRVSSKVSEVLDTLFADKELVAHLCATPYGTNMTARRCLERRGFTFHKTSSNHVFSWKNLPGYILKIARYPGFHCEKLNCDRIAFAEHLRTRIAQLRESNELTVPIEVPDQRAYFVSASLVMENLPEVVVVSERVPVEKQKRIPSDKREKLRDVLTKLDFNETIEGNVLWIDDEAGGYFSIVDTEPYKVTLKYPE